MITLLGTTQPNVIRRAVGLSGLALALAACSSNTPSSADAVSQPAFAQAGQAISSDCSLNTVGLACDPDGADGDATECEGLCWINNEAEVSCLPIAELGLTSDAMNGRICGDERGTDCGQSCENGLCVQKNARLGVACRPRSSSNSCDGVCTLIGGEPTCDEVSSCGDVGLSQDACQLIACNFETNTEGCVSYDLENATCDESKQTPAEAGVDSTAADSGAGGGTDTTSSDDASSDAGGGPDAAGGASSSSGASSTRDDTGTASSEAGASTTGADGGPLSADAGGGRGVASKVVGGACALATHTDSRPGTAWLWLFALGAWFTARRRTERRGMN